MNFQKFYTFSSVFLGTVVGVLIGIPALSFLNTDNTIAIIPTAAIGGLIGYKRRLDRWFFYLSLTTVFVLSGLLPVTP